MTTSSLNNFTHLPLEPVITAKPPSQQTQATLPPAPPTPAKPEVQPATPEQEIQSLKQIQRDLQQQSEELDKTIILNKEYGLTDINGKFQRFTPADGPSEVAGVNGRQVDIMLARSNEHSSKPELFAANNRRVAELIGLDVDNLNAEQLNQAILEVAKSGQYPTTQPAGTALALIYQTPEGEAGRVFIPLSVVPADVLGFGGGLNIDGNGSAVGEGNVNFTTTINITNNSHETETVGIKAETDGTDFGLGISGSTTSVEIDPNMQIGTSTEFGGNIGIGTQGPYVGVAYTTKSTDFYTGKTSTGTNLGFALTSTGPLFRLKQDLGAVNLYASFNTTAVGPGLPIPGIYGAILQVEGSPSYGFLSPDGTHVDIFQGTNNEPVGSFGFVGVGPIAVPIVIPGNFLPTRRIELSPELAQPQQIANISETRIALNDRATDSQFSQEYQNVSQMYTALTGQPIKLNSAEYAANVLPLSELNSGRYNHIVEAAEVTFGTVKTNADGQEVVERFEIVNADGEVVVTKEQLNQAALQHFLENNPQVANLPEDQREIVLDYAVRAVERPDLPSISELLAMGLESSEEIPYGGRFSITTEPRLEVIETPQGPVIAAQVAINLALSDNDERWVVAEQYAPLDPNIPMRLQIENIRDQVTTNTTKMMQQAHIQMASASNRLEDLSKTRAAITEQFESIGFAIIPERNTVNQRWNTLTERLQQPAEQQPAEEQ